MTANNVIPEFECFDSGIVRSVAMYKKAGMFEGDPHISLVMGVASGMPAKPEWVPLLTAEMLPGTHWQVICIGRSEVWDLQRKALEEGGNVRTGLEDTFYLPNGEKPKTTASRSRLWRASAGRSAGKSLRLTRPGKFWGSKTEALPSKDERP